VLQKRAVRVNGIAATKDGALIVSCGDDQAVRIDQRAGTGWANRFPRLVPVPAARCVAIAPDCRTVASAHADRLIRLWNCGASASRPRAVLSGAEADVLVLRFDRSGARVAAGCADGGVWLWDLSGRGPARPVVLRDRAEPVLALAFLPEGESLVVATGRVGRPDIPVELAVWDVPRETNEQGVHWPDAHPAGPADLRFAPDARLAVWGGTTVWTVDVASGRSRPVGLPALPQPARSIAFSPDGRFLALGLIGSVRLWEWTNRTELPVLDGAVGAVDTLAVGPAAARVVAGGAGVVAWDRATKAPVLNWRPAVAVAQVELASDGRHLLTANANGTVYVVRLAPPGRAP
jgi:WD40 repeat protein